MSHYPKMTGLPAIKDIKRVSPKTKILTLTVHEQDEYILEAFRSGADGYCLKDAKHEKLNLHNAAALTAFAIEKGLVTKEKLNQ